MVKPSRTKNKHAEREGVLESEQLRGKGRVLEQGTGNAVRAFVPVDGCDRSEGHAAKERG